MQWVYFIFFRKERKEGRGERLKMWRNRWVWLSMVLIIKLLKTCVRKIMMGFYCLKNLKGFWQLIILIKGWHKRHNTWLICVNTFFCKILNINGGFICLGIILHQCLGTPSKYRLRLYYWLYSIYKAKECEPLFIYFYFRSQDSVIFENFWILIWFQEVKTQNLGFTRIL